LEGVPAGKSYNVLKPVPFAELSHLNPSSALELSRRWVCFIAGGPPADAGVGKKKGKIKLIASFIIRLLPGEIIEKHLFTRLI
jgi:hypothetical protein